MQKITKEMIDNYHQEHGEDFIDQTEHLFNGVTLSAFMAGIRQEIAPDLWDLINEDFENYSVQQTQELYQDKFGDEVGDDLFYEDFVVVLNTTKRSRRRALRALLGTEDDE